MALCPHQTRYNIEKSLVLQKGDLKHFIQDIIFNMAADSASNKTF